MMFPDYILNIPDEKVLFPRVYHRVSVLPMANSHQRCGLVSRARAHARRTVFPVLKSNTGGERRMRIPLAF